MSDHGSTEENATGISSENVKGEVFGIETLTQEDANVQLKGFIAPPTRQLQKLTGLVQGMTTTRHPDNYSRTEFGTFSGRATHQSDMATGVHRTRYARQSRTRADIDDETTYPENDKQIRPTKIPEMTDPYEFLLQAIPTLESRIHPNNPRLIESQVLTSRGTKDNFNEIEHLL